jgi:hypothetical protein
MVQEKYREEKACDKRHPNNNNNNNNNTRFTIREISLREQLIVYAECAIMQKVTQNIFKRDALLCHVYSLTDIIS